MHIERNRRYLPGDIVYIYMNWYRTSGGEELPELYVTDFTEKEHIDDTYYIGCGMYQEVWKFAASVNSDANQEQVQFLWEIFQANQSE